MKVSLRTYVSIRNGTEAQFKAKKVVRVTYFDDFRQCICVNNLEKEKVADWRKTVRPHSKKIYIKY